jgi:hypothetical protein
VTTKTNCSTFYLSDCPLPLSIYLASYPMCHEFYGFSLCCVFDCGFPQFICSIRSKVRFRWHRYTFFPTSPHSTPLHFAVPARILRVLCLFLRAIVTMEKKIYTLFHCLPSRRVFCAAHFRPTLRLHRNVMTGWDGGVRCSVRKVKSSYHRTPDPRECGVDPPRA